MSTPPDDEWENHMPKEDVDFCMKAIAKLVDSGEFGGCCDNFRGARKWKSSDLKRFKRISDSGCCGSFEKEIHRKEEETGKVDKFYIGFNYGH